MASKVDLSLDLEGVVPPGLPVLKDGKNSLVAPNQTPSTLTPRQKASQWAYELRLKIKDYLDAQKEVDEEDSNQLKHELIAVFILALQQDNRQSWVFLHEVLSLVEIYKGILNCPEYRHEVSHYIERILHHANVFKEKLFDLQIEQSLAKVFPEEVNRIRDLGLIPSKNYCIPVPVPRLKLQSPRQLIPNRSEMVPKMTASMLLPDNTNPYSTHIPKQTEPLMMSKPLTIGDIRNSIAMVAMETAARESIWSQHYGTVTTALATEIPEEKAPPKEASPTPPPSKSARSSTSSLSDAVKDRPPKSIREEKVLDMDGRQAVEYFAKLHHLGKIESIYFNIVENRHFKPYDLRSCPKNKANEEHYVFSTFGVLHVYPDQPNESMSLAEWQREAVLWRAISSIPFFKNFLIRKMFHRWFYNKRHLDFMRHREIITNNLLPAIPAFGAAMLQYSRLLKELITIKFLPFETGKTYSLSDFENQVNYKNIQAERFLERFFRYCKMVMDVTAEESFKKLKHCEEQLKKKTVFSKDSLHMQRIKKENRSENLRKAKGETRRLGNFVKLVDQVIVEHMFYICKSQVISFVDQVLKNGSEQRDGFFSAKLVFTKQDVLGLLPARDKFVRVLSNTLTGIPNVLTSNAIPIDGSVPSDHETVADDTESSAPTKSDAAKSVDNMKIGSERRKSTARSSMKLESQSVLETDKRAHTPAGETTAGETTVGEATEVDSQMGVPRSVQGEDKLMFPVLEKKMTATKEEDEMGVATPDMVLPGPEKLQVTGEGFMGQYEPLSKANLEEKLDLDSEYQLSLNEHNKLMDAALEEIDQYCEMNSWLNGIHQFCKKWNDKQLKEFKGMAAYTIEQRLTEFRQWSERVRNFDKNFVTENNLFLVDCTAIHEVLLPHLNDIYLEVVTFVAEEAKTLATDFCSEMKIVLENLKDKRESVDAFAKFAKNFTHYKKNAPQYQQRVEYIKSLYEVIRMGYNRQLTTDEEKYEENVSAAGEAFMMQMQDASEFVNTQTPLMTKLLEDTFQRMQRAKSLKQKVDAIQSPSLYMKLEKEVQELAEKATTGKFLDTNQNPSSILQEMREIREKFFDVVSRLRQASRWREAICGEAYNLDFLEELTTKMNVRQEVWKYVEVTRQSIHDWKSTLFRKMNIKKALEKITEWQTASNQLKPDLPPGDHVLSSWCYSMADFKKNLPVLHKLANEALKERHWKAIFVGMNETYDPNQQYTVHDLLSYDLEEHAQLIHNIYLGAIAEFDLELKINMVNKFWEEREFKLAKHIPDSVLTAKANEVNIADQKKEMKEEPIENDVVKKPSSPRRRTKLEKYRQERAAATMGQPQGLNVADDDFFILIEVEELKYQLQHSRISIKAMMQSPYLGDLVQEVEYWHSALQQIEEITDLWCNCQKKWLYLLKVFEKFDSYKKFQSQSPKFEAVHNKFKDWMRVVSNDSKVLTVVHRKRGEKGYRLLQGDNLRNLFLDLIKSQEEILKHLESLMEACRMEFPRLYFLSNSQMVDFLGISRNPKMLLPTAKKCFPSIQSLTFDLPVGTTSLNPSLDFALHADKLEVTSMHGIHGEEVPLFMRVQAFPKGTKWLRTIESVMKNSMAIILQKCIQARIDEGSRQPLQLLEELSKIAENEDKSSEEDLIAKTIKNTFCHWLLRFPVQSVLVAEGIMWARTMMQALEREETTEVSSLQAGLSTKNEQYIELIREMHAYNGKLPQQMKQRLYILLCGLVNQNIHNRDIMDDVIDSKAVLISSFEWQKVIRYHIDIQHVLRAKREEIEVQPPPPTDTPTSQRKAGRGRRSTKPLAPKVRVDATIEEPPKLSRTRTVVSMDYEFGPCSVVQLGSSLPYDYEYLGPVNRLVLTPLTERTFLSLTQSLRHFHCGTLMGPPGTGKSETIKELAKLLGRAVFTMNCSDDITVAMISQMMMGSVQSGCWTLLDDTDRMGKGLLSVAAQHLEYLRSALRALQQCSDNQYKVRGYTKYDKKPGIKDKIIRRNSLTTLHPLPNTASVPVSELHRQNTVPHGFNEKGLVTYFEDTWIAEKDLRRRRHSIEKEIEIKESEFYKSHKPPPLFYEVTRKRVMKTKSDSQQETQPMPTRVYAHRFLGNIIFAGKLMPASANYGCFMTVNTANPNYIEIPEVYRLLMRPCVMVVPDMKHIAEALLCTHGFTEVKQWSTKLVQLLKMLKLQLKRSNHYQFGLKDLKGVLKCATAMLHDEDFKFELFQEPSGSPSVASDLPSASSTPSSSPIEMKPAAFEEYCLVYALKTTLLSSLGDEDSVTIFNNCLRDIFPAPLSGSENFLNFGYNALMAKTVQDQLAEDNLDETPQLISMIMQLHAALQLKNMIILAGPAGSGKTTCCTTLARAINRLNYLQFAPDHSKDELINERELSKISKRLKDSEHSDEEAFADDEKQSSCSLDDGSWDDEEEVKAEDSDVEETVKKTRKTRPTTKEVSNKPKECADYPKIDIVRLSPTAFPPNQFIGYFEDGMWHGGLLSKIMADSSFMSEAVKYYIKTFKDRKSKGQTEIPSVLLRWIVLDGILHPMWADSLNTLFDEERKLCLANVDRIYVEDTTSVMIETGDLCEASPATISRCTVLYFNKDTVQWKSIFDCWLKKAKNRWILTNYVIKMWEDLVVNVFGPTIKFINSECLSAQVADAGCSTAKANTVAPGIQEVQTFIRFISVLLDKSFLREDFEQKEKMMEENAEKPSLNLRQSRASSMDHFFPTYLNTLKGLFAFSYIWSFGGYLHERYKERFNKFAMDVLYRTNNPIRFPMGGSVFDFCLEDNTGNFIRWSDKQQERTKVMAGGFILTTEVEKYTYLVDLLIGAQQPVLLSGMPGVGKSSLIQNMILPKHSSTSIMMSQAMNSNIFQRTMVAQILELKHKATNTLGGPGGTPSKQQKLLFFIEDLNTSQSNGVYQPPLELLKQVLSDKGTYDQQRQEFQEMSEASFLACSTLPCVPGSGAGHSCSVLSSRLTRLFVNLTLFTPSLEGLQSLYGRSLQNWLEEFPTYSVEHHFEFARAMTLGLLDMYHRIKEKFRPSPANAHYVFTLHDIARVVHGILLMSPRSRTRKMMRKKKDNSSGNRQLSRQSWDRGSRPSLGSVANVLETGTSAPMMRVIAQLWCHECTRTFGDRLILEEDCNWYSRLLEDTVMKYFCMARDDPKSEMAAICEETVSQVGHLSPPLATSEEVLEAEEESSSAKNSEAQDTSNDAVSVKETEQESSEIKSVSMKTDLDTAETKSLSQSQSQSQSDSLQGDTPIPDTASTIQTAYSVRDADTETLTEGVSARHDADSASEYETEMSETTEGTSNSDSSETESEYYYDTPKDYDAKKASLRKASRESSGLTAFRRESYYRRDSSTHSTDTVSVGRETPRSNKLGPGTEGSHTNRASGAGSKVGIPSLKTQSRGSHGNIKMKTVTFKAGLLADWEHEAYFGPLMKLEEIKAPYDSLTDVIFTKFIFMTHSETHGLPVEKGYVESSEDSLADALYTCLNVYNAGTSQRLELVFFSEAIRHISRLSRVLAIQGGHALLLGMTYSTGRATLVRLASYIAHCKLFEPKPQTYTNKNLQIVREHIKRACHHTGILGKPTVLLIHEDLGTECLQDICCLMAEGTSPGLYSEEEIQTIVSMMMPGGVQTKRVDKIEQAFERYLKKVRQNLHIIVCLNYRGNSYAGDMKSLHTKLKNYPGLLKYTCSVDLYKPWRYDAYVKIAEVWLEDQRSKIHIPWHPTRMLEQMNMTAQAIAYIHLSAKSVIERQFCHQKEPLRFYSPLTFMEFVHLFRVISAYIVKTEKENILKHERALSKVNEAYDSINEYKRQVSDLMPKHKAALNEIKQLVCEVEEHKLQYIEALDKCKDQEAKIEELQEPLELLRREAQAEFDKVNPNYQAALTALSVLNKKDLEEVKAYRAPPVVVKYVLNALCLLFDVPQDWENAKLLLIRENVVEDMIFYDKDNIPDDIFETLGEIVDQPLFDPDIIKKVSVAAAGIAKWVHAVYKYAHIHRNMQPRLQNLFEQEEQFSQAQAKLGQLRVDANRIKGELENKITAHKSSVKRAKTIEKHMQSIEKKIARAVNLMEHMSMQHYLWKSELKKAKNHVLTAPGDALVTAACVLYHGPLEDRFRAELTQDWLDRCRQGNFVLSYDVGQERYPLSSNNLDGHYDGHKDSEMSSSHAGDMSSVESNASGGIPLNPEIRIFKYPPAVYDTRKYYRSELKKQGSMEYDGIPNNEPDDSDDEDEQSILITRTGFLLQDILSDFDELSKWRLDNLPTDLHSIQNALLMRVSCFNRKHCWPLLIDPDNQAEVWVKNLQSSQNIFQEKDLRSSTPDEVDGIPLEMSGMAPEDSNLDRLPPSRGTTLTFSDVISEGHITERTTYTSASTITYTTDYTKSGGRHSRNTWNTEELRPVTSVTNSWETLSLRADQTIDHPEFNLWIVEADDSSLDSKLINAIVHGITVLVTHLERKPLDPLFRGLLLKQFFVDKDGNRIIKVGTHEFKYHPNFRLYLSTSVPLFLKGDGLFRVPIHRLCIINMSLSDEAIINLLLTETMKVERKEFEGQKRSNENDIILHRQRLVLEHELIREKTLNLPVPLLEDKTMLESLLACQKEVEKNRMILEETRYMGDHLEEKFANYMNMIMHTAVIFNTIKKMCVLQHFYYLPFYKFIEIYNNVLKERYRGKGSTGAPQSRALELSNAMSMAIYRYVSLMFFEHHMNLFQLLVAIESMRLTRKTSTKEVSLFINGFEKQGLDESALLEQKPDWMASEAWIDCLVLEQLHHPFHGLKKSLLGNKNQWREYFEHPVTLLNPVPGTTLQELSVFQKALLWKITNPDRLSEVAMSLTLYELGSMKVNPDHYNIKSVYSYLDKATPAVFILPNPKTTSFQGTRVNTYITPAHEVKRLAKEVGMDGKVRILNFGVKGQTAEARQVIEECTQNGYWLLLQNYHLADEPEIGFFTFIKDLVYSKWTQSGEGQKQSDATDSGNSLVTHSRPTAKKNDLQIHNTFQLWISTMADDGRKVPGVLVQHGVKVTCEQTCNFKSTLQKSYRSSAFLLNDYKPMGQRLANNSSILMPIALLHSLLLQQTFYGRNAFARNHFWTLTDLALATDMFKTVMKVSHSPEGVQELVSKVYYDHCIDTLDAIVVKSLASTLTKYATEPQMDMGASKDRSGVVGLLKHLLQHKDSFNLRRAVDSLEELSSKTFGLPESADRNIMLQFSRSLFKGIIQVTGAPELFQQANTEAPPMGWYAEAIFPSIISKLQDLPELPETRRNQVYPVEIFLHYEVEGYKTLLQIIQSDVNLLQRRSKGEILLNAHYTDILESLCQDQVPKAWTSQTFPSKESLKDWIDDFAEKIRTLTNYVNHPTETASFNLSVFLRPDRFLEAVKQTYARMQFVDVNCVEFDSQVMPAGINPSMPPKEGVFISGLRLYNALWDTTRGVLMSNESDTKTEQSMPIVWLKPADITSNYFRKGVNYKFFSCPVFCSTEVQEHCDQNVVTFIPLPTLDTPDVWHQARVFMISDF